MNSKKRNFHVKRIQIKGDKIQNQKRTMNGAIMGIKVLYVLDMVGSCRLFLYMQMKAYSSVVY